jgi:hypothetical protein
MPENNQRTLPQIFLLASITLACLLPFVNKAFNIDEPLFIWVAKQIQHNPFDYYGFKINWYGFEMDAYRIIKNPPFAAYYLALVGPLSGWREIPLHLALLLPACAAALGNYFLAREFTKYPLVAALIGILNPAFLLCSATVMCDTTMLAFYVWAVFIWIRGVKTGSHACLFGASLLVSLCCLTKYFGISLIPLMLLYLASRKEKPQRALYLLMPIAVLCWYQWSTELFYGRGLLLDAASYAGNTKGLALSSLPSNLITGLSFTGGCFISTLFFLPRLWPRRTLLALGMLLPLAAWTLSRLDFPHLAENPGWGYFLQLALLVALGAHLLVLAVLDYRQHRDSEALLLLAWIAGTFLFAAVLNWTVNGRSILPMSPVVGLVLARLLERRATASWQPGIKQLALPLGCAWAVSMALVWTDYRQADTSRAAAEAITKGYGTAARPLWFQGHWGFQYYMQEMGAKAYDRKRTPITAGDIMAIPENNTNAFQEIMDQGTPLQTLSFAAARYLTTMNYLAGAGYYSSGFGPLPFRIGESLEEKYYLIVFPTQRLSGK